MKRKLLLVFILGLALGWWLQWFWLSDACYDAGGYWEPHGSYCYGARPAHPNAESKHP